MFKKYVTDNMYVNLYFRSFENASDSLDKQNTGMFRYFTFCNDCYFLTWLSYNYSGEKSSRIIAQTNVNVSLNLNSIYLVFIQSFYLPIKNYD